jgi:hypothetical protein
VAGLRNIDVGEKKKSSVVLMKAAATNTTGGWTILGEDLVETKLRLLTFFSFNLMVI